MNPIIENLEMVATLEARRIYHRAGLMMDEIPKIAVKPVRCGRFSHTTDRITLPCWLFTRNEPFFFEWYVAHELAHGLAGKSANHGPIFQMVLAGLAPLAWHWESTYKPKEYERALRVQIALRG